MKKVRMMIRCIAWPCFIIGLVLLISWAILERWPGVDIPLIGGLELETMFWGGAIIGLCSLILLMIVEDSANWESICRWIEKRKE